MDAIFFATKRAFHGILRVMRFPLACFGLTPARFDMLYVLYESVDHRCWQSAMRRVLGVTRPTVSKMLRSLQELGLVKRERDPLDGRERVVSLTEEGLRRMQAAHDELVASGAAKLAVDSALVVPRQHDRRACSRATRALEWFLGRMRLQFGDSAYLNYNRLPQSLLMGAPAASRWEIDVMYCCSWLDPLPV